MSAFVLQGFSCGAAKDLPSDKYLQLVKALKDKHVTLAEEQLSCMAKRVLESGRIFDFSSYPEDLLLFFDPAAYENSSSCKDYFRAVGQANISILPKGSLKRTQLLEKARGCFGNSKGASVSEEEVQVLNNLACDLDGVVIEASHAILLNHLTRCESFTPDQEYTIQKLVNSDNLTFGHPSNWTLSTLSDLGSLVYYIRKVTWDKIPEIIYYLKTQIKNKNPLWARMDKILKYMRYNKEIKHYSCPDNKTITVKTLANDLLPILYPPNLLQACLPDDLLKNYLGSLTNKAFTDTHFGTLKTKLDQLYPNGLPAEQISQLGSLATFYSAEEMSKWQISTPSALSTLLQNLPVGKENSTVILYRLIPTLNSLYAKVIIGRYTTLGNTLNAAALNAITGPYLCYLDEVTIATILPSTLRNAQPLDISTCTQRKKNILYDTAKEAFKDKEANKLAHYILMKSYLGGAPAADLKELAKNNVDMDIGTFLKLNPEEVMKLSSVDVSGLLGINAIELHKYENNLVTSWAKRQTTNDLISLGFKVTSSPDAPIGYIEVPVVKVQTSVAYPIIVPPTLPFFPTLSLLLALPLV
uniref:Mesothelin n=1 Tax=Latimeria chalumnae TaxID=7897 RepID=H3A8S7_LATCH